MNNKKKPSNKKSDSTVPDWAIAWSGVFPNVPLPHWKHAWSEMPPEEQKRLQEDVPEGFESEWPRMSLEQKVGYSLIQKNFQSFRDTFVDTANTAVAGMQDAMERADAYQLALLETLPPPEDGIGDRIKERREELRLNIEELARLTKEYDFAGKKGISPSTLRRYEYKTGGFKPGAREICLLCDALDISADWLVRGVVLSNANEPAQEAINAFLNAVKKIISTQGGVPDTATQQKGTQRSKYVEGEDQRLERLRRAKLPEK